jgi:hypothetical protein
MKNDRSEKQTNTVTRTTQRRSDALPNVGESAANDADRHVFAVLEYSAQTLQSAVALELSAPLATVVATRKITNFEWLRGRALSRVGIVDGEDYGHVLHGSQSAPAHARLFERSFKDGGVWDW